jgi:hypothetical protein
MLWGFEEATFAALILLALAFIAAGLLVGLSVVVIRRWADRRNPRS